MTLLILRPLPEAEKTQKALEKRGLKSHIIPLSVLSPLDVSFDDTGYDAVIFTSQRGTRETSKPVFQLDSTGEELAVKINASPFQKFLWGAGTDRAVDLRELCPTKQIDLVVLYEMTALNPTIDDISYTGVLHYSAKHAEILFTCEGHEKLQAVPHFCLSKRIEQTLPKDVIKMSAEKPTEEALITLVEETITPVEKPMEKPLEKPKSMLIPVVLAALLGAGASFAATYFMQKPAQDLSPLLAKIEALESKPMPMPVIPPAVDLAPLSREITLLKERAKVEALPLDLAPLEKRLASLEQNQASVLKLIEKHNQNLAIQAQIAKINAPTASQLLKLLPTLKQSQASDTGVMAHVKSFVKITKTGDVGIKDLETALNKNDLNASLTAWNAQTAEFRAANTTFETTLNAAIAGEKAVNTLKSQLNKE